MDNLNIEKCSCGNAFNIEISENEKIDIKYGKFKDLLTSNGFEEGEIKKYFHLSWDGVCAGGVGENSISGIIPFKCQEGGKHIIFIKPKFAENGDWLSIISFMIANCIYPPEKYILFKQNSKTKWGKEGLENEVRFFILLSYFAKLNELIKKDFRRYYIQIDEEIKKIKGKINISKYVKNLIFQKKNLIPCKYSIFTYDNLENRILKLATTIAQKDLKLIGAQDFSKKILPESAKSQFDEISEIDLADVDFGKSKLKYISSNYKDALSIAEILIKNKLSGQNSPQLLYPVLIKMPILFEGFVSKLFKDSLGEEIKVSFQNDTKRIFSSKKDNCGWVFNTLRNENGVGEKVIPDILIFKKEQCLAVADVKYKLMLSKDEELEKKDLKEEHLKFLNQDVYQIYYYLNVYNANNSIIIFPFYKKNENSYLESNGKIKLQNAERKFYYIKINLANVMEYKDLKNSIKKIFI